MVEQVNPKENIENDKNNRIDQDKSKELKLHSNYVWYMKDYFERTDVEVPSKITEEILEFGRAEKKRFDDEKRILEAERNLNNSNWLSRLRPMVVVENVLEQILVFFKVVVPTVLVPVIAITILVTIAFYYIDKNSEKPVETSKNNNGANTNPIVKAPEAQKTPNTRESEIFQTIKTICVKNREGQKQINSIVEKVVSKLSSKLTTVEVMSNEKFDHQTILSIRLDANIINVELINIQSAPKIILFNKQYVLQESDIGAFTDVIVSDVSSSVEAYNNKYNMGK